MKWWTLEQALAWGMWRDEDRAETCGEGRRGALEPRQLAEVPILSDAERQQIVGALLERGEVVFTAMSDDGSSCGFEQRGCEHEESGCYVFLSGWRERTDAPLCILEALHWVPPREDPILDYLAAISELEQALREEGVHATGEDPRCEPIDLPPRSWLYAELVLTNEFSGKRNRHAAGNSGTGRLRFPVDEIKALWPGGSELHPSPSEDTRYPRKRGRPRTSTEMLEATAAKMLELGNSNGETLANLTDVIAQTRSVTAGRARRVAKEILATVSGGNS